jgi:hypothetical protein
MNRVLIGPERREVTRDRRNVLHEEPHNLYSSLFIRAIKSRRIK